MACLVHLYKASNRLILQITKSLMHLSQIFSPLTKQTIKLIVGFKASNKSVLTTNLLYAWYMREVNKTLLCAVQYRNKSDRGTEIRWSDGKFSPSAKYRFRVVYLWRADIENSPDIIGQKLQVGKVPLFRYWRSL